jgi:hypothetical protein
MKFNRRMNKMKMYRLAGILSKEDIIDVDETLIDLKTQRRSRY